MGIQPVGFMNFYRWRQTKSKAGKRWVKVYIEPIPIDSFAILNSIFNDDQKIAISAAVQVPSRMLFGEPDE